MTDQTAGDNPSTATAPAEKMAWDSRARRMVTIYLPLACFVIILLFPFYWMAITSFKPNAELYDFKNHNPFLITARRSTTSTSCCSRRPTRAGC